MWVTALVGQNITVSNTQYSTQELIEDILINSGCIANISVTNSISGNFSNTSSFGYFSSNGSNFPFADGIVLSTGKLSNVPGPNNNLSDDNATNWNGDQDLENILNLNHTTNATVIEFDFTPNANRIQFRYIFASEEYREGSNKTCQYSDAFAFLIRPSNSATYENIAVIPGTTTPVKVTTIHPAIPGGCPAENEAYFEQFNPANAPINFNGQTAVLTAETDVVPGSTYHIKLVIADDSNYRYDSAVFLEGGSFNISANLGENVSGLCPGDTYTLSPEQSGTTPINYKWYQVYGNNNETLITEGANESSLEVTQSGTYKVIVEYGAGCKAIDEININYADFNALEPVSIYSCTFNQDGLAIYKLPVYNEVYTGGDQDFEVTGYYISQAAAEHESQSGKITNPNNFHNTSVDQKIYVRVETNSGCYHIVEVTLKTGTTDYPAINFKQCPESSATMHFNLADKNAEIEAIVGHYIDHLDFYANKEDAVLGENIISADYVINKSELPKSIYARIDNYDGCKDLIEIKLGLLDSPQLDPTYSPPRLCLNVNSSVKVYPGIIGDTAQYNYHWNTGATTASITVTEPGTYQVEISKANLVNQNTVFCSVTKSIDVKISEKPAISYKLLGEPGNYSVQIIAQGIGNYEYALDQGAYQKDSIFSVSPGTHYIYARDRYGCGAASAQIEVIGFMKFFTPNADGHNDYWRLLEVDRTNSNVREIQIYDRYGKLLTILPAKGEWDGTFHGKPMPSNDYWFKIIFKNGNLFTSHFSLIR